jgi:hypothetical protein
MVGRTQKSAEIAAPETAGMNWGHLHLLVSHEATRATNTGPREDSTVDCQVEAAFVDRALVPSELRKFAVTHLARKPEEQYYAKKKKLYIYTVNRTVICEATDINFGNNQSL